MPGTYLSWLFALIFSAQAVQDPPLPKEAAAKLDEVLKALDSDDAGRREAAQHRLHELHAQYGTSFVDAVKTRSAGAPIQVKASIEDFLAYRDRVMKACKVLSAFDVLDTPDPIGKRFVIFNTGAARTAVGASISFSIRMCVTLRSTPLERHRPQ